MNLFGTSDPRMQGRYPQTDRATIGPSPQTLRQMDTQAPQGGMSQGGYQSPSQGLFAAYMSQLFNQRYAPPVMPGGAQQFQGYRGFGSPLLPARPTPAPAAAPGYPSQDSRSPLFNWTNYNQT